MIWINTQKMLIATFGHFSMAVFGSMKHDGWFSKRYRSKEYEIVESDLLEEVQVLILTRSEF